VVLHGRIHAGKRELVLAQSEISQCEDFRTAPPCEGSTSVNDVRSAAALLGSFDSAASA
jgi:hypothetical protein